MESEAISGYYNHPWLWDSMRANCSRISQFSSPNDPLIPFQEEQVFVHEKLKTEPFFVLPGRGHFMDHGFPELVEHILALKKSFDEINNQ